MTKNDLDYERYSPLDDQLISRFKLAREVEVEKAISRARKAFETWSVTTIESRGRILRKIAQNLELYTDEIAKLVRDETGKPIQLSLNEVAAGVEMAYLMAAHGRLPIGRQLPSATQGRQTTVTRVPRGVAALIVSYNTPIPNYAWKVFPALISGNTAILKPSQYTPLSSEYFGKLLLDSGVPEDVLVVLQGDSITGRLLVQGDVDLISFTGSSEVGKEIARSSGDQLKKTILELGGANPLIVFDDANISQAASAAVQSAFSNAGQRCASGSRIVVHESVYENFMQEFLSLARKLTVGPESDSDIGTLVSPDAAKIFEKYLRACEEVGANVERVGTLKDSIRSVARPAVISNLDFWHPLAQVEFFGPATRFFSFDSEKSAIEIANCTSLGLTAALWTKDFDRAYRVTTLLKSGVVNINGPTHGSEPNMPFGGFGDSGNGTREAGVESLDYYSDLKVISTFNLPGNV